LMTGLQNRSDHSHHLEHFKRPWKNAQRSGSRSCSAHLVDNPAFHSSPGEFAGHRQSDRPSPDHENVEGRINSHESFDGSDSMVSAAARLLDSEIQLNSLFLQSALQTIPKGLISAFFKLVAQSLDLL
jgi:hypothetical protein